jgi:hypothetical protein
MTRIVGQLHADILANDNVRMVFAPTIGDGKAGSRDAKSLDIAETDFISTFGLSPVQASGFRKELEQTGSATIDASIDAAQAAALGIPAIAGVRSSSKPVKFYVVLVNGKTAARRNLAEYRTRPEAEKFRNANLNSLSPDEIIEIEAR